MIEFKPVRLEDRTAIERYTIPSDNPNCDMAFANMYCWRGVYHSAWAVVDGFLVVRFMIDGGRKSGYMQPMGRGDFSHIIPLLAEDAHARGERLRLVGLTAEGREMLRTACSGGFAFSSDRATEDYIYRAEDLRTLAGRRYQPKRNHINRFTSLYPDYRYEELTAAHRDGCMAVEREWCHDRGGCGSDTLTAEQRAMQCSFENFEALGIRGGALYVGSRMVAFTYGSAVNDHTFCIHVEKADTRFEGAFTMINRLFAERLPDGFTLINREEDLGIEGLRKSKLSYHPALLQPKYTAIHLHPDEVACKKLWQRVFGDNDEFVDSFIVRHYHRSAMLCAEEGSEMVSMLHLVPFDTEAGRATYIYGVATHPDHRGRGHARRLMERAMEIVLTRGETAFLIPDPEQPWLREFYARFGFSGSVPAAFHSPDGFDFGTGDAATDMAMVCTPDGTAAPKEIRAVLIEN